MDNIKLRKALHKDKAVAVGFYNSIEQEEQTELDREEKIGKAILEETCYIILAGHRAVGFVIFDYRFFGQGWIELMILDEAYRGKGIGGKVFDLLGEQCKAEKLFTSTNRSNTRMQKALAKAGFSFAGQLTGLDEVDPELFYYRLYSERRGLGVHPTHEFTGSHRHRYADPPALACRAGTKSCLAPIAIGKTTSSSV